MSDTHKDLVGFKARVKTEENTVLHKLSDDKISGKM